MIFSLKEVLLTKTVGCVLQEFGALDLVDGLNITSASVDKAMSLTSSLLTRQATAQDARHEPLSNRFMNQLMSSSNED